MISLYSGTPGSGKSLHAARRILFNNKFLKIPIICNFYINTDMLKYPDLFTYVDTWSLKPDYLIDFSLDYFDGRRPKEDSILLFIDEAQLIFNTREWKDNGRKEWLSFFQLHRHYGYEIILCCQFDEMLDKQLRCLIEYEYKHRKLKNAGWRGWLLQLLLLSFNLFMVVKMWYPIKEYLSSEFIRYNKKYGSLYDTFELL